MREGALLFSPGAERIRRARLTAYLDWLRRERGLRFDGYQELWQWSVTDLEGFWASVWDFTPIAATRPERLWTGAAGGVEARRFGAEARCNYVDQVLAQPARSVAVVAVDEAGGRVELTYGELVARAGAVAAGLRSLGVGRGDRVAAVLPNGLPAVIALLATASIGAVWSSCAPEFGAASMVDRFRQIAPKVLLVADGYRYGGKEFTLADKRDALEEALAPVQAGAFTTVVVPSGDARPPVGGRRRSWQALGATPAALEPEALPGDHPLWILYSSGTTGLPKAIVHSHAGIVLEHAKVLALHQDLGPGDRFCWYTSTGWMMWNYLVGGLLVGATVVLFDGNPMHPDDLALWRVADAEAVSCLGVGAPYLETCRKLGLDPKRSFALAELRTIGATGAPLSPAAHGWASVAAGDDVLVGSISGGTDVCTAFLASCALLPVRAGHLQCRALGAAVQAWDDAGRSVTDQVGELVLTEPMPSMPIELWGDADGSRLHESYFAELPGAWRHGDFMKLTAEGDAVVYGRSDATMNRGGIRTGTAELYRVVDAVDGVADSLAVDTSELGREGELVVLVVLDAPESAEAGTEPALAAEVRSAVRSQLSPRHVPDRVLAVEAIPRTLNGKKVEVPVRRILLGAEPTAVLSPDALVDPAALDSLLGALRHAGLLAP